jgi:hypothetical protein
MNRVIPKIAFAALLLTLSGLAYGIDYLYLTDHEQTVFGDWLPFSQSDSLDGPVRSNECLGFQRYPAVSSWVMTAASCNSCPSPRSWWGPHPYMCDYGRVEFPTQFAGLRNRASAQGHFYGGPGQDAKAVLADTLVRVYLWPHGTPFDTSLTFITVALDSGRNSMFFDCPLILRGILRGELEIGSSSNVGIEDNVLYADADPVTGVTPASSTNYLTIAGEAAVKILNTVANGRNNSSGYGLATTNPAYSSVTISAGVYALETFTFEQPNDADSGYICEPCGCNPTGIGGGPDDRGTIYLYGGLVQGRRGYVHRSSCSSTGYLQHWRYDARWQHHYDDMSFPLFRTSDSTTSAIDFGDVPVDSSVWDTADVYTLDPATLGGVTASWPFEGVRNDPGRVSHFRVPVHFVPPRAGLFRGYLNVSTSEHYFQIPLSGRGFVRSAANDGLILHPSSFILSAFPNPFNSRTVIRFTLPERGRAKVAVYDLQGRLVRTLLDGELAAGENRVSLDANMTSGIYFLTLNSSRGCLTQKLLLVK